MDVRSPVAGVVQMLMVEDGVEVVEGEQLMSIESMKTLFYCNAPCAGRVSLVCNLGQTVSRGEIVCRIL